MDENTISAAIKRGRITLELAIKVEQVVGAHVVKREWLRPDLYRITDSQD